jgi:hypothetical protein
MEDSPLSLSQLLALHRRVKTQYAGIQHQLGDDQRRAFRTRIATLSGLVRKTEDHHWRRLFGHLNYFRSDAHVRAAVSLSLARAQHTAPVIAQAAIHSFSQDHA